MAIRTAPLAVPLKVPEELATKAPNRVTTFYNEMVRCQATEAEAEGPPLESGEGPVSLLVGCQAEERQRQPRRPLRKRFVLRELGARGSLLS
jgi:hypothetical protein